MEDKSNKDHRVIPPEDADRTKEEETLDEALYDTFPASDPAPTTPRREDPAGVPTPEEIDRARKADQSRRD